MNEVVRLVASQDRRPIGKGCSNCKFLVNPKASPQSWMCGMQGYSCRLEGEEIDDAWCGPQKRDWVERDPEPPTPAQKPGFWSRLGDAIIERISCKCKRQIEELRSSDTALPLAQQQPDTIQETQE